jgi:outer membrane receptor protein involved in Fe transport
MHAKSHCIRVAVLALLSAVSPLPGQQTTGAVRGVVTDPTGALIPGVLISATNDQTSITQTTRTNTNGAYVLPLLPPGVYTVSAERAGFAKAVRNNVLVRITETESVDFAVQLGSVAESVTVADSVSLVQSETSAEGRVIERQTISALPLSTRNFTQLLGLTAGVVTDPPNAEQIGFGTQNPSVNGSRRGSNNYLLDGNVNNNPMNNDVAGVGIPSVDFIQEFKVITNMATAEYGRNAGSTVNVVTRSGTNQFHGSLFEFLRNDKLVARPFFAAKRGQNIQNQFGGTAGGPVWIPGLYKGRDRTFFFFGFESLRQRNTNSNAAIVTGRVPMSDERRGQFATAIRDPLTGQPFAGGLIPPSRINPTSALLLERYVPLPNVNAANNFLQQFGTPFDSNQYTVRLDHEFGPNDRFMARYFATEASSFSASGRLPGFGRVMDYTYKQLAAAHTHVFRPNLLNEARFGYYKFPAPASDTQRIDPRSVGIAPMNDVPGLPGILVTGFLGYGYTGNDYSDEQNNFQFADALTWVHGTHSMKFGAEYRYNMMMSSGVPFQGRFAFNGQYTSDAFADFLLAAPNQIVVANGPAVIDMRASNYNFFVQDDWKVSRRLTLNIGLRYEYDTPPTDVALGQLLNFYPELYRGAGTESGLVIGGKTPGVPASTVHGDRNNFGPRFGFAYAFGPQSRTVLRGGYGIFYDSRSGQVTQQKLFEPPYSANQTVVLRPADPPRGYVFPAPIDLSRPTETVRGGTLSIRPIEKNTRMDYVQQWNFSLQREIRNGLLVSASYIGTRGLQLFRATNINYPRLVGSSFVRPYDGLTTIVQSQAGANSDYHSAQFSIQRRFARGASLLAAYTFGKALDDSTTGVRYFTSSTGDPADLRGSRGLADFDRTHRLVVSFNVDVPNPFGADPHGMARALFSGWELSGVVTIQSGTPFSVTNSASNLDRDGQAGSPGTGGRADRVDGVPQTTEGDVRSRLNGFLNRAAFSPAPRSRYGTLGRNTIRGPGAHLWDTRLSKVTPLHENLRLRFLAEAFNTWNHAAFGNPGSVLDTAAFGTIRTTLSNARIIQLGLKLEF